jgi:hypothetical protein
MDYSNFIGLSLKLLFNTWLASLNELRIVAIILISDPKLGVR